MTEQQQTDAAVAPTQQPGPAPIRADIVDAYNSMIAAVPDAQEGAGLERILAQIAEATDVADLDAPWRTSDMARLAETVIVINDIAKMQSDFKGGLPWFLIVDATDEATGEHLTVTTGAVSVVAQLVKLWALGALPARARVKISDRPTRSGFNPQHLEFLPRRAGASNGSGAGA